MRSGLKKPVDETQRRRMVNVRMPMDCVLFLVAQVKEKEKTMGPRKWNVSMEVISCVRAKMLRLQPKKENDDGGNESGPDHIA